MKRLLLIHFLALLAGAAPSAINAGESTKRANQLRDFIHREKAAYEERESYRNNLAEELDKLNAEQNEIRRHVESIVDQHKEISMALENLSLEFNRQKELEKFEKKRLWLLYKVVYKVKKDGVVRFLFPGKGSKESLNARMRILFRTLRSRSVYAEQLKERIKRLNDSESRLQQARLENQKLMDELTEQEELLSTLLKKKRVVLSTVVHQQEHYQSAVKEYKRISKKLATLFKDFEKSRTPQENGAFPKRGTLPTPIEVGHLVRGFGKSINEKFGTVTQFKGVEIQAEMNAPVRAVLAGTVEFEGWVKGMGNVVILHHGNGFYSLSGHLYKSTRSQGTKVDEGEVIGLVGDTGSSDTPSLYFELRENSKAVDPIAYFSKDQIKRFL